jgi:hypothetical protein
VILDSLEEAIEIGRSHLASMTACYADQPADLEVITKTIARDKPPVEDVQTVGKYRDNLKCRTSAFNRSVEALLKGDPGSKGEIIRKSEELIDLVTDIEPSLVLSHRGFERAEEGAVPDANLIAAGEDRAFFRQRQSDEGHGTAGRRGRGYRVILSTDVAWFGRTEDNAALVGSLIYLLQQFGPVELWIQQGWLGPGPEDGVTLLKLDFSQGFDPTQLAFWCGHPLKDASFAFDVNMGLGRRGGTTAKTAEIPADLYLRGDWMKVYGVNERFDALLHTERVDIMTKWIAETAMTILKADPGSDEEIVIEG